MLGLALALDSDSASVPDSVSGLSHCPYRLLLIVVGAILVVTVVVALFSSAITASPYIFTHLSNTFPSAPGFAVIVTTVPPHTFHYLYH